MSTRTPSRSAFDRTVEMHRQISKGCTIAPAVHVALLRELCAEMELLLEENRQLRETLASRAAREAKSSK